MHVLVHFRQTCLSTTCKIHSQKAQRISTQGCILYRNQSLLQIKWLVSIWNETLGWNGYSLFYFIVTQMRTSYSKDWIYSNSRWVVWRWNVSPHCITHKNTYYRFISKFIDWTNISSHCGTLKKPNRIYHYVFWVCLIITLNMDIVD